LCGRSRLAAQRYLFVPTKAEAAGSRQLWSIMSSREEDVRVNGDHQLVADGGVNGEGEGELEAVMQQLEPEGVRALHARVEAEWGPVLQSACQTAAARALWASAVRDPAAGVLAGEKHLRGLQEKMRRDELAGAREVPGVMIAVRTLWFDARIEAAVGNLGGAPQVVLLGAGSCIHEMRCFITTNSKFRATSIQCFLISTMHIQRTRSCLL
jgi:hypothetical protein